MHHFDPGMAIKLGVIRFFPIIKITAIRQVRMPPASTMVWAWRLICVKLCRVCKDQKGCLFCSCLCLCGRHPPPQKKRNMNPMADDAIIWGSAWGLGSPLYICGYSWFSLVCIVCKCNTEQTNHLELGIVTRRTCTNYRPVKVCSYSLVVYMLHCCTALTAQWFQCHCTAVLW